MLQILSLTLFMFTAQSEQADSKSNDLTIFMSQTSVEELTEKNIDEIYIADWIIKEETLRTIAEYGKVNKLKVGDILEGAKIKKGILKILEKLPLKELTLSLHHFYEDDYKVISKFDKLEYLEINMATAQGRNLPFDAELFEQISKLKKLKHIYLNGYGLNDKLLSGFFKNKSFETVVLERLIDDTSDKKSNFTLTPLNSLDTRCLQKINVDIHDEMLSDIEIISKFKGLKSLTISKNKNLKLSDNYIYELLSKSPSKSVNIALNKHEIACVFKNIQLSKIEELIIDYRNFKKVIPDESFPLAIKENKLKTLTIHNGMISQNTYKKILSWGNINELNVKLLPEVNKE